MLRSKPCPRKSCRRHSATVGDANTRAVEEIARLQGALADAEAGNKRRRLVKVPKPETGDEDIELPQWTWMENEDPRMKEDDVSEPHQ